MVNVVLVSDGERHKWYSWLSDELVRRGHSLFLPVMPSKGDDVNEWMVAFKEFRKYLDDSSVIIGHGAGRVVVLKVLEEKLKEVNGAFFISGLPLGDVVKDFSLEDFNFSAIKDKADNFFVYASDNDGQDSLDESEFIAESIGDEVLVLDDVKFFNGSDKFEDLLIHILSLVD